MCRKKEAVGVQVSDGGPWNWVGTLEMGIRKCIQEILDRFSNDLNVRC